MPRDSENLPSVIRRMTAGQMLLDGVPREDVAARLNLSAQTVRRYQALVEAGGPRRTEGIERWWPLIGPRPRDPRMDCRGAL